MADTYAISGQRRVSRILDSGEVLNGVEVAFATKPSNVASMVFVPEAQYNPEDVRRLIEEAAANIEAIHTL